MGTNYTNITPHMGSSTNMNGEKKLLVLNSGELFVEYPDTGVGTGLIKIKIGDGANAYINLPYSLDNDTSNAFISFATDASTSTDDALAKVVSGAKINIDISALKKAIDLVDSKSTSAKSSVDANSASITALQTDLADYCKTTDVDTKDSTWKAALETKIASNTQLIANTQTKITEVHALDIVVIESGQSLPSTGTANALYFLLANTPTTNSSSDAYDLYLWNSNGYYNKIGSTNFNLDLYMKSADATTAINASTVDLNTRIANNASSVAKMLYGVENATTIASSNRAGTVVYSALAATAAEATNASTTDRATYALTADTVANASQVEYATSASSVTSVENANAAATATHANMATVANYSTFATNAGTATHASTAKFAYNCGPINSVSYTKDATSAKYSTNAGSADYSTDTNAATYADSTGSVLSVPHAINVSSATYAENADTAEYAKGITDTTLSADNADTADFAKNTTSDKASTAGTVNNASYSYYTAGFFNTNGTTSISNATTIDYAINASTADTSISSGGVTKATKATNASTATYAKNAPSASYAGKSNSSSYVTLNASTTDVAKNIDTVTTATNATCANAADHANLALHVDNATNATSATIILNADKASSVDYAKNADTATYAVNSATSSNASTALTVTDISNIDMGNSALHFISNGSTVLNTALSAIYSGANMSTAIAGLEQSIIDITPANDEVIADAILTNNNGIVSKYNRYLQGYDSLMVSILPELYRTSVTDLSTIHVDALYCVINSAVVSVAETTLTVSGILGTNYYVEVDSTGAVTYETTKTNSTSKICIGGFHYGRVRQSTTDTDVVTGIVPNSVWTLLFKPSCNPDAMVYLGGGKWGDIYLTRVKTSASSGIGGTVYDSSAYGSNPGTGTEAFNFYTFAEDLGKVGKRLPNYADFCYAANGAPNGQDNNTYAWSSSSNTARTTCGAVSYSVSSLNICDLVGNVWKWCYDTFQNLYGASSFSFSWNSNTNVTGHGGAYGPGTYQVGIIAAGGGYAEKTYSGSRAVATQHWPYEINANIGAWAISDGNAGGILDIEEADFTI